VNPRSPNIILYVMDCLRADRLGCYGHGDAMTPNVDRLAKEGVLYRNAFAQATWTYPSAASILSGMYPSALGIDGSLVGLPVNAPWLPEELQRIGYTTICCSANPWVSAEFGFARGFDIFVDQFCEPQLAGYRLPALSPQETRPVLERYVDVSELVVVASEDLHAAFVDRMDKEPSTPFFALIWSMDTHYPYFDRHQLGSGTPSPVYYDSDIADAGEAALRGELSRLYDQMVSYNDGTLGELVRRLSRLGRYDDTLIILMADHGEALGEHQLTTHSGPPFQPLAHVPLVLKFPDSCLANSRRMGLVQLIDVAPTLYAYLGLRGLGGEMLQGRDLLGADNGRRGLAYSEGAGAISLRTRELCYMRGGPLEGGRQRSGRLWGRISSLTHAAMYDRRHDPDEMVDLSRRLGCLPWYLALTVWSLMIAQTNKTISKRMQFDWSSTSRQSVVEDRLRALGYID
jgi:arylsulfatase A-like enzyme